jgi:hypothetical protein
VGTGIEHLPRTTPPASAEPPTSEPTRVEQLRVAHAGRSQRTVCRHTRSQGPPSSWKVVSTPSIRRGTHEERRPRSFITSGAICALHCKEAGYLRMVKPSTSRVRRPGSGVPHPGTPSSEFAGRPGSSGQGRLQVSFQILPFGVENGIHRAVANGTVVGGAVGAEHAVKFRTETFDGCT